MYTLWLALRSIVFYSGYGLLTLWFGGSAMLICWMMPRQWRHNYVNTWNRLVVGWLRICCGVKYEVIGAEHIPHQPLVVLAKHQSQWETFYLQLLFTPMSTILKKELLKVPGFGWGLRQLNPIAIDRSNPKEALRQIQQQGLQRLKEGLSVLVFPEGTRMTPGESGKYARGGANLATSANVPVVFVAHNAGDYWPARGFLKFPGRITVVISDVIDTAGKTSREITDMAQQWIEDQVSRIRANAFAG
jgi:1-acyl-sn-glycerol-3-phosphate acyltransferase